MNEAAGRFEVRAYGLKSSLFGGAVNELVHAIEVDFHAAFRWASAERHRDESTLGGGHQEEAWFSGLK
jgi:hypothetical protein